MIETSSIVISTASIVLTLASATSLVFMVVMCACCKCQRKPKHVDVEDAYGVDGSTHTSSVIAVKRGRDGDIGYSPRRQRHADSPNRNDRDHMLDNPLLPATNAHSIGVHRKLPQPPTGDEVDVVNDGESNRQSLTRDSSLSDLYATVDKQPMARNAQSKPAPKNITTTKTTVITQERQDMSVIYKRFAQRGTHGEEVHNTHTSDDLQHVPVEAMYLYEGIVGGADADPLYTQVTPVNGRLLPSTHRPAVSTNAYEYPVFNKPTGGATAEPRSTNTSVDETQMYSTINQTRTAGEQQYASTSSTGTTVISVGTPRDDHGYSQINKLGQSASNDAATDQSDGLDEPKREPSYRYITVRESLDVLRQRMAEQSAAREQQHEQLAGDSGSAHYYSVIGSDHGYETVAGSTPQHLYEDVTNVNRARGSHQADDAPTAPFGSMDADGYAYIRDTTGGRVAGERQPNTMLPSSSHGVQRMPTDDGAGLHINDDRPRPPTSPIPDHSPAMADNRTPDRATRHDQHTRPPFLDDSARSALTPNEQISGFNILIMTVFMLTDERALKTTAPHQRLDGRSSMERSDDSALPTSLRGGSEETDVTTTGGDTSPLSAHSSPNSEHNQRDRYGESTQSPPPAHTAHSGQQANGVKVSSDTFVPKTATNTAHETSTEKGAHRIAADADTHKRTPDTTGTNTRNDVNTTPLGYHQIDHNDKRQTDSLRQTVTGTGTHGNGNGVHAANSLLDTTNNGATNKSSDIVNTSSEYTPVRSGDGAPTTLQTDETTKQAKIVKPSNTHEIDASKVAKNIIDAKEWTGKTVQRQAVAPEAGGAGGFDGSMTSKHEQDMDSRSDVMKQTTAQPGYHVSNEAHKSDVLKLQAYDPNDEQIASGNKATGKSAQKAPATTPTKSGMTSKLTKSRESVGVLSPSPSRSALATKAGVGYTSPKAHSPNRHDLYTTPQKHITTTLRPDEDVLIVTKTVSPHQTRRAADDAHKQSSPATIVRHMNPNQTSTGSSPFDVDLSLPTYNRSTLYDTTTPNKDRSADKRTRSIAPYYGGGGGGATGASETSTSGIGTSAGPSIHSSPSKSVGTPLSPPGTQQSSPGKSDNRVPPQYYLNTNRPTKASVDDHLNAGGRDSSPRPRSVTSFATLLIYAGEEENNASAYVRVERSEQKCCDGAGDGGACYCHAHNCDVDAVYENNMFHMQHAQKLYDANIV